MDVSSGHCYKTSPNYKFMTAVMVIMIPDLPSEQSSASSLVEVDNFPSATCIKIVLKYFGVIWDFHLKVPEKGCLSQLQSSKVESYKTA